MTRPADLEATCASLSETHRLQTLDLRDVSGMEKWSRFARAFKGLADGGKISIVDARDPRVLYYLLAAEQGGGFRWRYAVMGPTEWRVEVEKVAQSGSNGLKDRVEVVLQSLRPYLQADGGDVELVDVDAQGVVSVRLAGACHGCPGASMTLQAGIERVLKERIPEVRRVEAA